HDHSCAHDPTDEFSRHLLRRQGNKYDTASAFREHARVLVRRGTNAPQSMHARLFRRQEGSLQMNPEHAWLDTDQLLDPSERRLGLLRRVADQGRKQRGGPEATMRGGDSADAL